MQNIRKEMRKISKSNHRQYETKQDDHNNSILNLRFDSDEESNCQDEPVGLDFIK